MTISKTGVVKHLHKTNNMSDNQGVITHEDDLKEITQTEGKKKFNIGDYQKEQAAKKKAEQEGTPPQTFTQPAPTQQTTAPKRRKEPPAQYIFRFVKPPDKKLWGKVAGRTYLPMTDTINWPYHVVEKDGRVDYIPVDIRDEKTNLVQGEADGSIIFQPRTIRFVATERSIFVDEQEKANPNLYSLNEQGRNRILDSDRNRDALVFIKYESKVPGTMATLWNYLWCRNQCANQHPKARRHGVINVLYEMIDFEKGETDRINRGKLKAKMYELASTARDAEMIPHAKYLNIPFVIQETGQRRDMDAIREDYKDMALSNPEYFEKTFSDPKVKIIHMIAAAVEKDELGIGKIIAGQAHWMRTRQLIAMVPNDRNPYEFLAEFMLTAEGSGFASQLKSWWQINNGVI